MTNVQRLLKAEILLKELKLQQEELSVKLRLAKEEQRRWQDICFPQLGYIPEQE